MRQLGRLSVLSSGMKGLQLQAVEMGHGLKPEQSPTGHTVQSAHPCPKENVWYLKNISKFMQNSLKLEKGSQEKCC